jgi:predicted ABC-type ATPase
LRFAKGGHSVPDEDVERRFYRSLSNFNNLYKNLSDKWQIFYNGLESPLEIAAGENEQSIVYDDYYYSVFKELIR